MAIVKRKSNGRFVKTRAVARRASSAVARTARRAGSAAGRTIVKVVRSERVRRVARRTGEIAKSSASITAMAQARGIPAIAGGFLVAKAEEYFRLKVAEKLAKGEKLGFLDDPVNRLAAEAFAIAFLTTSKMAGTMRQIVGKSAEGALGAIAAFYQLYTSKKGNPDDDYVNEIKAGRDGI